MAKRVLIKAGQVAKEAVFNDSPTAEKIWQALPIEGRAETWGEEIYFSIPVKVDLEAGAREVVEEGDLGYWPTGHAFCIFFGPTPASRGREIRAASAVNVIGRVTGPAKDFKQVPPGAKVRIEKAEESSPRR
ncbi:MAG: hypothetical protein HY697_04230 [Deltaproteobacteria bacterium]|nr:hypothetical protein [Deltaproteobacteria bacterium]